MKNAPKSARREPQKSYKLLSSPKSHGPFAVKQMVEPMMRDVRSMQELWDELDELVRDAKDL